MTTIIKCTCLKGNGLRIPKYGNALMLLMEYMERYFCTVKINVKNHSTDYFLIRISGIEDESHFVEIENYINSNL